MTIKPLHLRPAATLTDLLEGRESIVELLASPEYEAALITVDYGKNDPFDTPFPACTCGARAKTLARPNGRWMARCSVCDRSIRNPQITEWDAKIHWCQMNLEQMDYRSFPLFGLEHLDVYSAKSRLSSIYHDLMYKSQIASLDVAINKRNACHAVPAPSDLARMYLLRDLAKLALSLVRLQMLAADDAGNK